MANEITKNPIWDTSVGGLSSDDDLNNELQDEGRSVTLAPRGIFAAFPGATPKYSKNNGEQETDFRGSMARLFLQVPKYGEFVKEFRGSRTQPLARVLGGQSDEKTGTSGGAGYIDFLLQNVQHSYQEKAQIVETLADDHVAYFFGQSAPTFGYSGSLINTKQDDQAMNMLRLYRDIGRGTKLAQRNTLISIRYDGLIVSGAMTNLSWSLNAELETVVPFSFSLLVKQVTILPSEYDGGIVALKTQFATGHNGDEYLPFDQGTLNVDTAKVLPAMVPSGIPIPVASVATEPVQVQPDFDLRKQMASYSIAKTSTSGPTDRELRGRARFGGQD